jgi:hypothetical protein
MENGGKFMAKKLSQHQIQLTCSIVDMVDTCDIDSILKSVGITIRDVNCRYDLPSNKVDIHTHIIKDHDYMDTFWITADHTQSLEVTILVIKDSDTITASEKMPLVISNVRQYIIERDDEFIVLRVSANKPTIGVLINGEYEDISPTYEIREQTCDYDLFANMRLINTPVDVSDFNKVL